MCMVRDPQAKGFRVGGKISQGKGMMVSIKVIARISVDDAIWVIIIYLTKMCRENLQLRHPDWYDCL